MNLYLDRTTGRDKQLMTQSGVDIIRDEDGNITLTGSLFSITDARNILMKWKDDMSTIDRTTSTKQCFSKQRPADVQEQITAKMNESRYPDQTVVVPDKSGERTVHLEKGHMKIKFEVAAKLESNTMKGNIMEGESESATARDDYVHIECGESGETIVFENFQRMTDDFLIMTTDEGMKVYVYQGNICYLDVPSIVNSSKDQSAVLSKAGHLIEEEYRRRWKELEATQQGKVFRTSSGDLKHYYCILHACPPIWGEGTSSDVFCKKLKDVLIHSLALADDNKLKSIGLPAIGSGELRSLINAKKKYIVFQVIKSELLIHCLTNINNVIFYYLSITERSVINGNTCTPSYFIVFQFLQIL